MIVYCWAWGLPLSVVNVYSLTPLEKTNLSFWSSWQLQIASWLEVEPYVRFLLSEIGPHVAWTWTGSVLLPQSYRDHICLSPDVSGRHYFLRVIPSGSSVFLPSYLHRSLSPKGRSLMKTFLLVLSVLKSLTLNTLSSCESLFVTTERGSFSGWARPYLWV